jgi:hypothetical protein
MYYVRTFDSELGLMPGDVYGPYRLKVIADIVAYVVQLNPGFVALVTED